MTENPSLMRCLRAQAFHDRNLREELDRLLDRPTERFVPNLIVDVGAGAVVRFYPALSIKEG